MSQITNFNTGGVLPPEVPTQFTTDAGIAIPVANNLNVFGGTGGRDINTSGAGDTIHIDLDNSIILGDLAVLGAGVDALTAATGDISIIAGNLNLPSTISANTGVVEVNSARFLHSFGATNTFLGAGSGNFTLTGFSTVGIGSDVLPNLTSGAFNVAVGFSAENAMTSGASNTAVGSGAISAVTTSSQNTALGASALSAIVTGAGNTALGYLAGSALTTNDSNNIMLGNIGVVADNATIRIGTNPTHTATFIAGIDGVNVGSTAKVVTMGTAGTADKLGTATITAGSGITVTPGANTITIASTGGSSFAWSVIVADQTAAVNNGYFCNKAGTLLLALPAVSAVGDVIEVANENTALGIQFTQAAGQQILIGNTNTTLGAAGTLTTSALGDTLKIVCFTANTIWRVTSIVGNWTPA